MRDTDVAVVIPTFNHARFVSRAVQSVLDQSHPAAEIIVVDDGSLDDTKEALAAFGSAIRPVMQENAGVAAARNHGARLSTAPLLAFLDADDAWHPTKLARQVEQIQAQPGLGLVNCGLEDVDAAGRTLGYRIEGLGGRIARALLLLEDGVAPTGGSTLLMPRDAFDAVGGYDERLSTSADWDLLLRIAVRFPVAFISEPLVLYTVHESGMHFNIATMEHDTTLAMQKAFEEHPGEFGPLRRQALANLFMVLGTSYASNGNRRRGACLIAKSLVYRPAGVGYVVGYPVRRLRKQGEAAVGREAVRPSGGSRGHRRSGGTVGPVGRR